MEAVNLVIRASEPPPLPRLEKVKFGEELLSFHNFLIRDDVMFTAVCRRFCKSIVGAH